MGEMKLIVQRVKSASVSVDGETISSIGKGLCVLVGIHRDDTPAQRETLVRKLLNLRVFEDESGGGEVKRWDKSVKDLGLDVLCVVLKRILRRLRRSWLQQIPSLIRLELQLMTQNVPRKSSKTKLLMMTKELQA